MLESKAKYRIILSGGGTGGHIYPAIAIANQLKEVLGKDLDLLFVGAKNKMEMEKVPKAGYPVVGLDVAGFQRGFSWSAIKKNYFFPFRLMKSLSDAKRLLKTYKPHVVIGTGGYASGPVLRQAGKIGIPTFIQEQNSYAGVTNKILSKKAKAVFVAYPGMDKFFPEEKIKFLGNPVRSDIQDLAAKKQHALEKFGLSKDKPVLMAMGGSLGALAINEALAQDFPKLQEKGIQLLWQTGKNFHEKALKATESANKDLIKVHEFIYDMDLAYACADVVISRAGALSISELAIAALPSVFVPLPTAAEDHQTKNAKSLEEKGAAKLVKNDRAKDELVSTALDLLEDQELRANMQKAIEVFTKPNAAKEIAEEILKSLPK